MLICGEEVNTVNIAVVLDLTVNLINKEGLESIVKLVLIEMASNILHCIVRPVSMLNSMEKAVVLSYPEAVLESLKVNSRVE